MKCSKKGICPHGADGQVAERLFDWLERGIEAALKKSKVPADLANKVSQLIKNEFDVCEACEIIREEITNNEAALIAENQRPKGRVFDRAIVHMLELFYSSVLERSKNPGKLVKAAPEFFNIVPRGECLDLFLEMIKRQCIGDTEVSAYTTRLEIILQPFTTNGDVNWERVYIDSGFVAFLFDLFTVIFSHMKSGEYPVPALNNGMVAKHSPERINLLLKHMLAVWQLQQTEEEEKPVTSE